MPARTAPSTGPRRPIRLAIATVFALAAAGPAVRGQGYVPTVVAKTGDVAPGTGGLVFSSLGTAVINPDGTSAFMGRVTGPGVTANVNDLGTFYRTGSGPVSLLARLGDAAPGGGGAVFAADTSATANQGSLGSPGVGAGGGVGFRAFMAGAGVTTANDTALFSSLPGAVQLLAREGAAAGGTGGATFAGGFSSPQIRADNSVFFSANLAGTGVATANNAGLFAGPPGAAQLLVRKGDVAPGTGGATFLDVANSAVTNAAGTFAFRGTLVPGGAVTAANGFGIFGGTAGNVNLLLRAGDPAPGIGNAVNAFNVPTVLADGRFVLPTAVATGGAVTSANNSGLFVGTQQADLALVARKGDQVVNAPTGVVVGGIGTPIASAVANAFAFRSLVAGAGVTAGANDRAIFSWTDAAGLWLVARQGDTAPGTGGAAYGAFFTTAQPLGGGQSVSVGPTGATAFIVPLAGTGVTTANDTAIFVDTPGGVVLVVRKGDVVDLDPGPGVDLATIRTLGLAETSFGNPTGYSAVGSELQIAYTADFTDGRYASLISVVPVPEPGLLLGAAAAGLVAVGRVRRRRAG